MSGRYVLGEAGARKLRELLNAGASKTAARRTPHLELEDNFALPFAVQWAQSVGDSGAWIIWLPEIDHLVMFQGAAAPIGDSLEAAGGDYPEGWYILPEEALSRGTGGSLILTIIPGDTASSSFAGLGQTSEDGETWAIKICEASVDESSGARAVKQLVTSAIHLGGGGEDDDDVIPVPDEKSLSRQEAGDGAQQPTAYWSILGFGRFTAPDGSEAGQFTPSSQLEVGTEAMEDVAVLVREGDKSKTDGNTIGYRRLKMKSELVPSPFQCVKSVEINDLGNELVTHKITNNVFYWNGAMQEIADFDVSALMGGGTVWLVGKQAAATAETPEPDWEWSLAAAEGAAPAGGKVLNYKLYDFAQSAVACDYRTTFLALEDHTKKAKVEIAKGATATSKVVLDAAGDNAKVVVSDASGRTITLDPAALPDEAACPSQNIGVHQLICYGEDLPDGDYHVYHVLSCSDIDLRNLKTKGKTIGNVDVRATATATIVTFYYTDGTSTSISIPHGKNGKDAEIPEIEAPEITATKNGEYTHIFCDGELIATIEDGHKPEITAIKEDDVTTIFVDGEPVAEIEGGGVKDFESISCISDIKFRVSDGKLQAVISRTSFNVPNTSDLHPVEEVDCETIDIGEIAELDVVTSESYTSNQFKNVRKRVKVFGQPTDAVAETVFTTTPHSSEA